MPCEHCPHCHPEPKLESDFKLSKLTLRRATAEVERRAKNGDKKAQRVLRESRKFKAKLDRETQLTHEELNRVLY